MRTPETMLLGLCAGLAALGGPPATGSVLQYHGDSGRTGAYVDAKLTKAAVARFRMDPSFQVELPGPTYAQPLYVERGGKGLLIVATEQNQVLAISPGGALAWRKALAPPVSGADLPCGNIDPLGITGTPVVDPEGETLYLDAMTTPDGGKTKRHLVYALSVADGSVRPGWPVDVAKALAAKGMSFRPAVQNQRGGLALVGGTVYVPFGGHYGDCGDYHGWIVGVPAANPSQVGAWSTPARKGGIWAPGGIASDGAHLFAATGNTQGAQRWGGGEAVLRFGPGPQFREEPSSYFAPKDWRRLDDADVDIGSAGPVLFTLPGASPSSLVLQMGKDGRAYLLDRANLGGIGGALASRRVASSQIISAPAVYPAGGGTFAAVRGRGLDCPGKARGDLLALRIRPGAPPSLATAWCGAQDGMGSPIATSPDGARDAVVWSVGAEGDEKLRAFDGETGAVLFESPALSSVRRYQTPIAAGGRIYVAANGRLYAFGAAP